MPKQSPTVDRTTGEVIEGNVRPFADVLRDLGKGHIADEAAILLTDLVQAVTTYGRQGTFTLQLKVAPVKGSIGQVTVAATAKSSPPEADPIAGVFFTDDIGNLTRNDPRMDLMIPLREIAQPDAHLRDAK